MIRAPVSFFENNPIGILLNRCTRDIGLIDEFLPFCFYDAVDVILNFIGILVLNAYLSYWTIIPAVALLIILFTARSIFVKVCRHLKRLDGVTKSPVYSHLSTSLYGLDTLRAFKVQETFEKRFDSLQDLHSAAWFSFISAARWFGIVLGKAQRSLLSREFQLLLSSLLDIHPCVYPFPWQTGCASSTSLQCLWPSL